MNFNQGTSNKHYATCLKSKLVLVVENFMFYDEQIFLKISSRPDSCVDTKRNLSHSGGGKDSGESMITENSDGY